MHRVTPHNIQGFSAYIPAMNDNPLRLNPDKAGCIARALLLMTLTGCIGYVEQPRSGRVYVAPRETVIVAQDDYVYYPGYQVYYSSARGHYVYQDGGAWVTRTAPPRVSVDVLFASPSVRVGFHDAPAFHHEAIVRQYPPHWVPPGQGHGKKGGRDEGQNNGRKRRD